MEKLIEQWKPVKNYGGLYEISNFGRVKSLAKEWLSGNGCASRKPDTIMKSVVNGNGYKCVNLYRNRKHRFCKIHHLVWGAFGDKKRDGRKFQIDHLDENKLNNRIDNLQLLSQRQNLSKYHKTQVRSSEYTGVYWRKNRNKWGVSIYANGKNRHLGYFTDELKASNEYLRALKEFNETGEVLTAPKQKTSKYKGVCYHKLSKKWMAYLCGNGNRKYLGLFTEEYEAHLAYKKALKLAIV